MGQARKKYTQEYKDEAVELVISSGRPIAEIARNLGINEGTLANWVNTAKKSGKLKEKPLDTEERARLKELEEREPPAADGAGLPKKSSGVVCEGESVKFAFIAEMDEENKRKPRVERFPVTFMCEMLEVSPQGYYAWKKRAPSARDKKDVTLTTLIVAIHEAHQGRYGIDRIHADLARNGYRVSPKRVRRLARAAGLACVHPRPYKATTVQDKANATGLVDLVGRSFVPARKNELWYGDITYIFTMSGWAYLATVIDGFSRKVVGWSVADNMREGLVIDALAMAVRNRGPGEGDVVFHSDRGSQYTGQAFREACLSSGIIPSVGIPVSVSITPPLNHGTRRSRKSSSTCMHGITSRTSGTQHSSTLRCTTTVSGYRRR